MTVHYAILEIMTGHEETIRKVKVGLLYSGLFIIFLLSFYLFIKVFGLQFGGPEQSSNVTKSGAPMYDAVPTIAGQVQKAVQLQIPTETPAVVPTNTPFIPQM